MCFSVNSAFTALRTLIPTEPRDRKLSKIETLRLATSYIAHLATQLLAGKSAPSTLVANCLSVFLFLFCFLYVYLVIYLVLFFILPVSVWLFVCLSISFSVCLSVWPSLSLFISFSLFSSTYLFLSCFSTDFAFFFSKISTNFSWYKHTFSMILGPIDQPCLSLASNTVLETDFSNTRHKVCTFCISHRKVTVSVAYATCSTFASSKLPTLVFCSRNIRQNLTDVPT